MKKVLFVAMMCFMGVGAFCKTSTFKTQNNYPFEIKYLNGSIFASCTATATISFPLAGGGVGYITKSYTMTSPDSSLGLCSFAFMMARNAAIEEYAYLSETPTLYRGDEEPVELSSDEVIVDIP